MGNWTKKALGIYKDVGSKEEATHYVMDLKEYDRISDELGKLRKYRKESVQQVQRAVEMQSDAEEEMAEIKAYYESLLEQEKERIIEIANAEIEKAMDLNRNLKRIMVERANADRKMKPKKEHHGYRVVSQQQVQYTFDREKKKRWCYKVTYETPYSAKLNSFQARTLVRGDLEKIKKDTNIEDFFPDESTMSMFHQFFEPKYCTDVYVMEEDYRANYRSGYYEVSFYCNYEVIFI